MAETDCALTVEGLRDLLAGVQLEAGDLAEKLARCGVERDAATSFGQREEKRADAAEARAVWIPIVSSVATAIATVLTTWGITKATTPHGSAPAMVMP